MADSCYSVVRTDPVSDVFKWFQTAVSNRIDRGTGRLIHGQIHGTMDKGVLHFCQLKDPDSRSRGRYVKHDTGSYPKEEKNAKWGITLKSELNSTTSLGGKKIAETFWTKFPMKYFTKKDNWNMSSS